MKKSTGRVASKTTRTKRSEVTDSIERVFGSRAPGMGDGSRYAVAGGPGERDSHLASDYRRAADHLARDARGAHAQMFFRPVCFLYRHAIELRLKDLIRDVRRALELAERCGPANTRRQRIIKTMPMRALSKTHRLLELLDLLRPSLESLPWRLPKQVANDIANLDQLDPDGQSFRYIDDRDGAPLLGRRQRRYDLARVQRTFRRHSSASRYALLTFSLPLRHYAELSVHY